MPPEFLERSLCYSFGIEGVTAGVAGVYGIEEVKQNVEWAKRYRPLSEREKLTLREEGKALVENGAALWPNNLKSREEDVSQCLIQVNNFFRP